MRGTNVIGGIGGIVFAILTVAALFIASPAGGNYSASDIATFVSSGHRAAIFVAAILAVIATVALICLLAYLREALRADDTVNSVIESIFWGLGLAAATSFAVGWVANLAVPIAYAQGGSAVSVPPTVTYVISQVGDGMLFGAGGILLGAALITLALGARALLPSWLRWTTLVIGILALASEAFFPWFLLLLWGLVIGGWLLAAGERLDVGRRPSVRRA